MRKNVLVIMLLMSIFWTPGPLSAMPTVFPTGTTLYKPEKCWNGYTVLADAGIKWSPDREGGTILIDMNGNLLKEWPVHAFPAKILPGGYLMGYQGYDGFGEESSKRLVQLDWQGKMVWKYDVDGQEHDFQREGNPVGYFVPGMIPKVRGGKTLTIVYKRKIDEPKISPHPLSDTSFQEITWDGRVVWEWNQLDHFEELELTEEMRNTLYRYPGGGDWSHINSMALLGPNRWFDGGDERFHPDNIIYDSRVLCLIAIIDKKTGKIVWKVGPDYTRTAALRKLETIIGPHHAQMIPKGLPGEGNILVFDNGGYAGYGNPNPGSPTGQLNALRDFSRVIEFNPITLEVVWEYSMRTVGALPKIEGHKFFSPYMGGAQRLPNGNTLITESASGRSFEVTQEKEIVWEYISPFFYEGDQSIGTLPGRKFLPVNHLYRTYRVPYDWIPQLPKPVEKPVVPPPNSQFRVNTLDRDTSVKPSPTGMPVKMLLEEGR